ncbi:helix-turn-helix domain-containing protein [Bacillus seohaeanensis]|jgi:transcriptional regulator with XRE-family HTH domain|uniref:Helix-turn-helix domain-containing protein n=1 Tax=Bacillus seohaeanensis TaxID=284580 RepID=A0ABW5RT83_9BACI
MAKYVARPKKIRELMKLKGIKTQKELAVLVGVKEATISRFDSQTRYDIDVLISVSKALEMPVEDLFEIKENKEGEAD